MATRPDHYVAAMTSRDGANRDDEPEATERVDTAIYDQALLVSGWFASHADSGTPGPHVHLRAVGTESSPTVLHTSQVPALIDALAVVAERIERLWAVDGEDYINEVLRHSPNPNDPEVIRQRRIKRLRFVEAVAANLPEVIARLRQADNADDAIESLAELLDVDEVYILVQLPQVSLLSFTHSATAARRRELEKLEAG